ncbi:putative von Willebrand factor type A [Frankia canadensis]|uniref:Putative von Willebrand factor type A n=1 Tax=Frankia canadensis TaxID=1836972 RepID=A0A2I2KRW2_9ACTN|nr:VWA domain-containing protein [Frankia canadensis]SNQ48376.1 putative von Willebrand factor type A [Frankia canadensis]SOU55666.1 putative von Willebrand factor type A [Frankia canadensis]
MLLARGRPFDACGIPTELVLSTSADTSDLMRELTQAFVESDRRDGCRRENIQVVSPSAPGGTTKALSDGWPSEDLRAVGPVPHVWMPSSSIEVARVQAALRRGNPAGITLVSQPPVMSSFLLLAAPDRLVGESGWSDPSALSLSGVLHQAENSTLRIVRDGPEASTEGLVSTMALYQAAVDGQPSDALLRDGDVLAKLHQLEQATVTSDGIDDPELGPGCQAAASAAPDYKIALLSEQRVFAHNEANPPACGPTPQPLTALYPTDGVPLLDYPFVIVSDPRSEHREQQDVAMRLHSFLTSDSARPLIAAAGFRPPGGAAFDAVPPNAGIQREPPRATHQVDPDTAPVTPDAVIDAWHSARRRAHVLFAIDVSGSMAVPGLDGVTPLGAAGQAVEPALGLVSDNDQIGLWEFATNLDGGRDYVEKVSLGPAGTAPRSRRADVRQALESLRPRNGGTGLLDTIQAGIGALRADGDTTTADALVVFTDGINDKPTGIDTDSLIQVLNQPGVPLTRVFLLAFGANTCARPDLHSLQKNGGVRCENVSSTDVGKAVERVGSGLWGIN